MSQGSKDTQKVLKKISSLENMINSPQYNLDQYETYKVHIRVDNQVEAGLFKADPKNPGGYIAHETTFRAMKKDIFTISDPDVLKEAYTCLSCLADLDKQFWNFCPFCGEAFCKDN